MQRGGSSRKLERATYDSVAFRFIAGNDHPDHDTIATFRRRFLEEIEALFVQVLQPAREMGVLKMGTVALDGTKIHANASRHSALSYEHAGKIEAQLKAEVADLMAKAEAADAADIPDGMSIPDELARREERLRKLAEARAKIEARAKERHAREQAEHEAKLAARQAKAEASGKKPRGKPPEPPVEGPRPNDQINLTDGDSRIMPVAGGGFDQCYNAQAAVAAGSLLVVASAVSQAPTTSSNSNRCWTRSRLFPTSWASPNACWRIGRSALALDRPSRSSNGKASSALLRPFSSYSRRMLRLRTTRKYLIPTTGADSFLIQASEQWGPPAGGGWCCWAFASRCCANGAIGSPR